MENLTKKPKIRKHLIDKINKFENSCRSWETFQNLMNAGAFNKAVGPGKRSKNNKHRAYIYSRI